MNLHLNIPLNPKFPDVITVLVEIPKNSRNKYEYDPDLGLMRLDRVLPSPCHYTTEYGFVPRTLAGDGDAVDALVPMEEATVPGCLLEARPIGLLKMSDEKGEDFKILAVPTADRRYADVHKLTDIAPHLLLEIEHFFRVYKELDGTLPTISGWQDEVAAREYLVACAETFVRSEATV